MNSSKIIDVMWRASRMIYVTTRGGYTGVMPSGYPNLAVKYLKAFCQMLGIARFDSVEAEGSTARRP